MKRIGVVGICLLLIFNSAFLIMDMKDIVEGKLDVTNGVTYVPHSPIRIDSNGDFVTQGWPGSGTAIDPWVIEDVDIDGTGYGYCIYIGNTTDYFVVRDCNLHEASGLINWPYYYDSALIFYNSINGSFINNNAHSNTQNGMYVHGCSNILIANNTLASNSKGIYLRESENNSITNNNASSNVIHGIYLSHSDFPNIVINNTVIENQEGLRCHYSNNNIFKNNNASNNVRYGVRLYHSSGNSLENGIFSYNYEDVYFDSSDSNTLRNNTISSSERYGIHIFYSTNEYISNNTMINSGIYIDGSSIMYWNTHFIDITNTVDGKPVYYWKNKIGGTIPIGAGEVILVNCVNVIVENNNYCNSTVGVLLGFSSSNIIANNTFSNDYNGVCLQYSNGNMIDNNSLIPNNRYSICLWDSNGNTISHNTISEGFNGICFWDSDNNNIINNNVDYNENYGTFFKESINNTITKNNYRLNKNGIYISQDSYNNQLINNTVSFNYNGITLSTRANNNNVKHNIVYNNENYGISIYRESDDNVITNNTIQSNLNCGLKLYALVGDTPKNNVIFHNNIINNTNQAYDEGTNIWDNGYPSGGNYWSDYTGVDLNTTPTQDVPPPDGLGDTPYIIDGNSRDNYPLMVPTFCEYDNYNMSLSQGWNLISLPLIQGHESIHQVLDSIAGKWDYIQVYDSLDSDHWKTNATFKPIQLNDLESLNHKIGVWINITEPNVNFTVKGYLSNLTSIPLYAGWNLVGYPTLNDTMTVANALWGTGADRVEKFDALAPYRISEVGPSYVMKPGEGYWVHVPADTVWVVDW